MIDKKAFLLMVLLMSQLARAQDSQPTDVKVEQNLVQAVMSENELKYLIERGILILQEDGTLAINKAALKELKKNGYKSGTATDSVICLHGE